jgi:hypothetical protein
VAWVRYDDQFHMHLKVTAVIAEDAGAIALHVLGNTWSNTQKLPGFIPIHQPGMLLCDKRKGSKWAALLVKHGLWHRRGEECDECREEYAHLTDGIDGFVVHNAKEYRAPARDRTTPGTPSDLSEKRRQAGRAGGKASAARREQVKQGAEASQANGVSKTSNLLPAGVSPVVNASNEALTPDPEPEPKDSSSSAPPPDQEATGRDDVERVCDHLADRIEANGSKRPNVGKGWRDAARLLMDLDGKSERQVHNMIDWCQNDEFWRGNVLSMPKLREKYDQMRLRAEGPTAKQASPGSNPKQFTEEDYLAGWK